MKKIQYLQKQQLKQLQSQVINTKNMSRDLMNSRPSTRSNRPIQSTPHGQMDTTGTSMNPATYWNCHGNCWDSDCNRCECTCANGWSGNATSNETCWSNQQCEYYCNQCCNGSTEGPLMGSCMYNQDSGGPVGGYQRGGKINKRRRNNRRK